MKKHPFSSVRKGCRPLNMAVGRWAGRVVDTDGHGRKHTTATATLLHYWLWLPGRKLTLAAQLLKCCAYH
jgi:hypothetical protein